MKSIAILNYDSCYQANKKDAEGIAQGQREETKLNADFKTESFLINNYQKPIRRDRN